MGSRLALKNGSKVLDGMAILELLGEWVGSQCYVRLMFIVSQSGLEKRTEARGV